MCACIWLEIKSAQSNITKDCIVPGVNPNKMQDLECVTRTLKEKKPHKKSPGGKKTTKKKQIGSAPWPNYKIIIVQTPDQELVRVSLA